MKNNKLKKLENLKLRTNPFGLKNKLGIIAIVCLLIFAGYSGVNATIKLGNDGTTDWSMVDTDKIRTSNGKSFPATGVGLQDTIWSLNTTGGIVWIPTGTIDAVGLTINHRNISIIGSNLGNTILRKNGNGDLLTVGNNAARRDFFKISNIYFDGNSNLYTGALLNATKLNAMVVENCHFLYNNGYGIYASGIYGGACIFDGIKINACGNLTNEKSAFFITGDSNALTVINTDISVNNFIGIYVNSTSSNILLSGLTGESSVTATYPIIKILGHSVKLVQSTLSSQSDGYNMIEAGGTRCEINGNTFTTASRTGTAIHASSYVNIIGNYFYDCDYGINTTSYVNIEGNFFTDCNYGIKAYGGGNGGIITGNRITSARRDGMHIYLGGYMIIANNRVENSGYGTTPAQYSGIVIENSGFNVITNNVCFDGQGTKTQQYGIKEIGTSDDNIIVNNQVSNNNDSGITIIGIRTKIGFNDGHMSSRKIFGGTTANPSFFIYGYDTGAATQKYLVFQVLANGIGKISSEKNMLVCSGGKLSLAYDGIDDATFFEACGNVQKYVNIYGKNASNTKNERLKIRWGDGTNNYGIIESSYGGVLVKDIILDTSVPAIPVSGSCYWDESTSKLMIYNATSAAWMSTPLT